MNTKVVVTATIIALMVVGVGGFLLFNQGEQAATTTDTTVENQTESGVNSQSTGDASSEQESITEHLEGANMGEVVDATDQERVEVSITDYKYEISELTISEGTTVVWVNDGNVAHDVTSDTDMTELGSQLLGNGETYEYTFNEAGEYLYHCSPHPFRMRAAITVVE